MGPHEYTVALETRASIMVSLLVTEESRLNIIVDTIVNFSFDGCGLGDYCADTVTILTYLSCMEMCNPAVCSKYVSSWFK